MVDPSQISCSYFLFFISVTVALLNCFNQLQLHDYNYNYIIQDQLLIPKVYSGFVYFVTCAAECFIYE